jgi:molybdopterin-containing oxidoreductase family molybdopterin binding subunit
MAGFSSSALLAGCTDTSSEPGSDAPVEVPTETKFVVCHTNCKGQCPTNAIIRDNRIVHLQAAECPEGYEELNRLCIRGMSHIQNLYGPQRLQTPLRRTGERGAGQWEQITWDEAISEIATKWKGYLDEFGPLSITRSANGGNTGMVGKQTYARLFNTFGGGTMNSSMDNNCFVGMRNALGSSIYWNGSEWRDIYQAKTLVLWGWAVESQPMYWNQLMNQKEAGVKIIVIEPHYTAGARMADQWIPIQPGTDGALALGLMSAVIEEDLIDKNFLVKQSCGPMLVKADGTYLRESDFGSAVAEDATDRIYVFDTATGAIAFMEEAQSPDLYATVEVEVAGARIPVTTTFNLLLARLEQEGMTVAKASELCDIPEDIIRSLARTIADSPVTIRCGYGVDHYCNGYYSVFAIMSLGILTGNMGKPGAACGDGLNTYGTFVNYGYQFPLGFALDTKVSKGIPLGFSWPCLEFDKIAETGQFNGFDIPMKALFIHDTSIVSMYAQGDYWLESLKKFEFIVIAEQWMTSTAEIADIVLPVCHWYEMEDLAGFFNASCFVTFSEKALDPLYESKPDFEIAQLIGRALGYEDLFQHTNDQIIEEMIDTDGGRAGGVTLENLKTQHFIKQLPESYNGNYIYGYDGVWGTPTGKVQFYLENPAPENDYGQTMDLEGARLPHWVEPFEVGKNNPLAEKYPLQYFTENTKYRLHSQFDKVAWLREMDPEPLLKFNPVDADARSIKKGDKVRVFNDRGSAVMAADINPGLRPGVVSATKGWHHDAYGEGNFQNLTTRSYEGFNLNQNFYDARCEVEKV